VIRRALVASLHPASTRVAQLMALGGALAMCLVLVIRNDHRGGWRIDEAEKLSATYALHHLLRGDVHHPDWFRSRIDRTNPPVGKYVFGLAILIAGKPLPPGSTLTRTNFPLEETAPMHSEAEAAPFLPMLAAARWVSLLATALCAGIVAGVAARVRGILAAVVAVLLFAPHWIVDAFGATAILDPLLTLLVLATAPLALALWNAPERAPIVTPLLGIVAAMAFQTRLNGGIALAACLAAMVVAAVVRRRPTLLLAALVMTVVFAVAAIAVNPYYWASAPPDPSIPAAVRESHPLAPRVISRFEIQLDELQSILLLFRTGGVRMPLWAAESAARTRIPWTAAAKTRYLASALAGDPAGVLLVAGALAGVLFALARRERGALFLLVWCGTIIVGTCVWLPLPWSRYLFVILPPLALLAGFGLASMVGAALGGRLGVGRVKDT
jgi:4-amino-4-deoxy-L-arabinose transferase-like glycosyltransferase